MSVKSLNVDDKNAEKKILNYPALEISQKQCKTGCVGATLCECKQMLCARLEFTALIRRIIMLWAHLEMMETHALLLQYFITHLERRRRWRGSSHTKRVYPSNYARELYDVLPDACAKLNYSSSVRKQCCRGKIITRRTLDTLRRCEKDLGGGGGVKICRARQKLIHCACCCNILWVSAWIQLINGIAGAAPQNAQCNNWPRSRHIACTWREHYHISLSGCQRNFALANCFLTFAR